MAHYCKDCKHAPAIIIKKAIKFFGPDGLGLRLKEEVKEIGMCCASLEGEDSHIFLKASKNKKGSEIEVEAYKLDQHAEQFLEIV